MIGQDPQIAQAFRAAWEPLAGQGGAVPGAELLNTITDAEFPGALLPARGSDGIPVFYAVAPDARRWYLLTPLLTAFAGLTTTDFYGPPTVLNPADSLEKLIVASGCHAAARLRVTTATATLAERALGRLYSTWRQAPHGRRALMESTGALLSRFHAALAIGDVATARTILAQLEHERRLDALNLNFLEITMRSTVGDWSGLLALEYLPHVLAARRPPAVSAAIAEAVWRQQVAPALESGGVAAAIAVYRTETRQFAAVLGNLPRNALRCGFAVMAVAVLAGDLAYAALIERIGEAGIDELPPALVQALRECRPLSTAPVAAVVTDPLTAARAALLQAAQEDSLEVCLAAQSAVESLNSSDRQTLLAQPTYRALWRCIIAQTGATIPAPDK
ncbi:MAG: hypothetical protein U1F76_14315 [Candidatus Competibacteraceae bacterium]